MMVSTPRIFFGAEFIECWTDKKPVTLVFLPFDVELCANWTWRIDDALDALYLRHPSGNPELLLPGLGAWLRSTLRGRDLYLANEPRLTASAWPATPLSD